MCRTKKLAAVVGSMAALMGSGAWAALLTATVTPLNTGTVDLTAEGTLDWAKFEGDGGIGQDNTFGPPVMVGKAGASEFVSFSNIANPNPPSYSHTVTYSWTDGDGVGGSLPSQSSNIFKMSFAAGDAFTVTAKGDTVGRVLRLYAGSAFANPTILTISLPGATPLSLELPGNNGGNFNNMVTIEYTADLAGDLLTMTHTGNAGFAAATLQVIPEPASLGGLAVFAVMALRRRV